MGRKPFVREKILDAAFDLFARRGYEAVSTRDIASHAQVGPASMYRHFPSKETLGREVYTRALRPLLEGFATLRQENLSRREILRRCVTMLCEWYDARPRALALLIFAPHDFCPEELEEDNPRNPRNLLKTVLQCDSEVLAVLWGAMTGPLQDRYLRRRSGQMAPVAPDIARVVIRLMDDA